MIERQTFDGKWQTVIRRGRIYSPYQQVREAIPPDVSSVRVARSGAVALLISGAQYAFPTSTRADSGRRWLANRARIDLAASLRPKMGCLSAATIRLMQHTWVCLLPYHHHQGVADALGGSSRHSDQPTISRENRSITAFSQSQPSIGQM